MPRRGKGDYEVGFGKPPKHSQFKPGESGNPKGRDKGSRGLRKILDQETRAPQTIRIDGNEVTAPRLVQIIRTSAIRAANGDLKAQQFLLPLVIQCFGLDDRDAGPARLSPHDQAILDALLSSGAAVMPDEPVAGTYGDGDPMLPPADTPSSSDGEDDG